MLLPIGIVVAALHAADSHTVDGIVYSIPCRSVREIVYPDHNYELAQIPLRSNERMALVPARSLPTTAQGWPSVHAASEVVMKLPGESARCSETVE